MRVLFVSHSLPLPDRPTSNLGGMQRVAYELRDALAAHPEVRLTTRVLESSWRWTGARTGPFLARLLLELPRLVRREGVEVVLFSSMVTASVAVPLRRRLAGSSALLAAIPVGRDVTLPNPLYQPLVPRVLSALDVVLPISRATGEECLRRGLDPATMHVVPCGVDLRRFPPAPDRGADRTALLEALRAAGHPAPPRDALLLAAVGRHQERKGFHWFVDEVMPRLPPRAVLLLAGGGPMTGAVREAVARHGLEGRVLLLGRVPDETLATLYRGADLFVMPNIPVPGDIEGFGVVMLEAGISGLPIVAADLEGIRDVVREGENGTLLPTRDAGAFVATIARYLEDPDALQTASASAARFTRDRFAWSAIVDRMLEIFRAAAPRSRA